MKVEEVQTLMEEFDISDNALVAHGFTTYMRDYFLLVDVQVGPAQPGMYQYLFKYCVEAHVHTALSDKNYKDSIDDRLIDYETGKALEGYVWGVKYSNLWGGWRLLTDSTVASEWNHRLQMDFHEVAIETESFHISLIFSGLEVKKVSDEVVSETGSVYIPL